MPTPLINYLQSNADAIHQIALNLTRQLKIPVLDTPEDMSLPFSEFFDHAYPLNVRGTHIRTYHLIEKLRERLA